MKNKDIKVNGKRVNKDVMINVGDKVEIFYTQTDNAKFEEIYKDQNVLVINKFSGYTIKTQQI